MSNGQTPDIQNGQQPENQEQGDPKGWGATVREIRLLLQLLIGGKGAVPAAIVLAAGSTLVLAAKHNAPWTTVGAAIVFLVVGIGLFAVAAKSSVVAKLLGRDDGDSQAADMVTHAARRICDTTWGMPSKAPGGSEYENYLHARQMAIERGVKYRIIISCSKFIEKDHPLPTDACEKECERLREFKAKHSNNFDWRQLEKGPLPTAPEVLIADDDKVLLSFSDISGAPALFFQETNIVRTFRSYFDEVFDKADIPYGKENCPYKKKSPTHPVSAESRSSNSA